MGCSWVGVKYSRDVLPSLKMKKKRFKETSSANPISSDGKLNAYYSRNHNPRIKLNIRCSKQICINKLDIVMITCDVVDLTNLYFSNNYQITTVKRMTIVKNRKYSTSKIFLIESCICDSFFLVTLWGDPWKVYTVETERLLLSDYIRERN